MLNVKMYVFNVRLQTMGWGGEGVIGVVTVAYNGGHLFNRRESEDRGIKILNSKHRTMRYAAHTSHIT